MTRTLEELNQEIDSYVRREASVRGYLGAMPWSTKYNLSTAQIQRTFNRWYRVGDRFRARQHRKLRLFDAIGLAFHRDHATPNLYGIKMYAAQQYTTIKKADIRLGREYQRRYRG